MTAKSAQEHAMTTIQFKTTGTAKVITVIDTFLILFCKLKQPEEKR